MSAGSGPGRRLTPAEEDRAAELYLADASTRTVARELAISRSSAQALRVRLMEAGRLTAAAEAPSSEVAEPDQEEASVTEHHDQADAAELAQLAGQREALAAEVVIQAERAEASLQAVAELEAERVRTLAEGRDAQSLRGRRRDAEDDLRDWTDAARLARGRLDELDRQIAAVQARIADAALRAELAEAIAARDVVLAATGERQRTAVLAVRTAAEEFTAALADEQAAVGRVEQLAAQIALAGPMPAVPAAVSTRLSVHPDMANGDGPLSLSRALFQAREGQVRKVAILLAEAFGYLPPSPAELAEEAERRRRLVEDGARAEAEWKRRSHQPAPPVVRHMPEHLGASYGVDARGNPLPPPSPAEMERRSRPEPARPVGWLGGQPFPG